MNVPFYILVIVGEGLLVYGYFQGHWIILLLVLHFLLTLFASFVIYDGLPLRYKNSKNIAVFVIFVFIFFMPIVSHLGFFALNNFLKEKDDKSQLIKHFDVDRLLILDEVHVVKRMFGEGGVATYIKNKDLHPEFRLKAFLIISELINPLNIRFLKLGLSDPIGEIRMLSFSIISRIEKKLNDEIYTLTKSGDNLKVAKLYWEFIYLGLADEVFEKIIINKIFELLEGNSSRDAYMLYLKIYLREKNFKKIKEVLEVLGESKETAPYFMELAFYERDFDRLRELMRKYPDIKYIAKFYPIYRLWNENS